MGMFRGSEEEAVRGLFAKLEREVELVLVLGPEETPLPGARDIDFTREARRLVEGLAAPCARASLPNHGSTAASAPMKPLACRNLRRQRPRAER